MNTPPNGRPHDAASLVITCGSGADAQVLLGRREPRDRFLPDLYVFPGGRVDPSDASLPALNELLPGVAAQVEVRSSAGRARALAVASVRETHEETGLVLGEISEDHLVPALEGLAYVARAITPAGNPIRYHARFFHTQIDHANDALLSNGELLDLMWHGFDAALALPMLDITAFLLRWVARRIGHPAGDHEDVRGHEGIPFIHYRDGARQIHFE